MGLYAPHEDYGFDLGFGRQLPDGNILNTGRVETGTYFSQARFEREREIFKQVWLYVGRVEELGNPGDWITKEIDILSLSVLIVRGKDDKIRAFHNICAHRGMKLVWDKAGRGGKFSCPYHAWAYDAQGSLTHVPDAGCFPYVEKAASGLSPITCEEWEGFLFINLHPKQTLRDYLGPVAERFAGAPFGNYRYAGTISEIVDANWKLGLEAASEGYHVQVLHRNTARDMLWTPENPHVHYVAWEPLGSHRFVSIERNPDFAISDRKQVQGFSFRAGAGMVVAADREDAGPQDFSSHPAFNRDKLPAWASDQVNLFPNFNIHVALNGWWSMTYWPLEPGKALWQSKYYSRSPASLREAFAAQYSLALNRDTITEDNICLRQQQVAMESGAKPFIQFGEQEIVCSHFAAVWKTVAEPVAG